LLGVIIRSQKKFTRVNEKITLSPLLVIDETGAKLGSMPNFEARKLAGNKGLDLVEVNPDSRPPVCKIMDWGRHKYDEQQKVKAQKSKQKKVEQKEIRLTAKIGNHDITYKAKRAREFFDQGHKVKVSMRLRGRENIFHDQAMEVFEKFSKASGLAYESRPKRAGNLINADVSRLREDDNAETKDTQSDSKES